MKKFSIMVFTLILLVSVLPQVGFAEGMIKVKLNGEYVQFDQPPIIDENDRTLVPIRFISEELGAKVTWEGSTQTVIVTKDDRVIELSIGKTTAEIDGRTYQLDTSAKLVNGRTLVPIRFISEALGLEVGWEGNTQTVILNSSDNVKITYQFMPNNRDEMIELVQSLPSFSGTTIVDILGDVVINLKGSENSKDLTISVTTFEEPIRLYDVPMTAKYKIVLFKNEPNEDEVNFIKDFLKVYYPTEYEKAIKHFVNRERILTTYDNRQFLVSPLNNQIKIYIGE
ncbi:hypothetical protein BHF71_05765 [Vulcanibacillus modesticaldus]|uniref:Copper amine oxidase-like N-terminal domain-containing protein n=1 Tax=Vulcanibacillus modesticaldus TaxID=337097 RepID=A0A1D2YWW4_9BACI|nr:copper amine oxidase N-terminal domain-containing protein [Vulcanibacillus modesticaldus]OEG00194.1 hypothetical protein BHF71_05765 [Vulcanibacillus modesticaldus]